MFNVQDGNEYNLEEGTFYAFISKLETAYPTKYGPKVRFHFVILNKDYKGVPVVGFTDTRVTPDAKKCKLTRWLTYILDKTLEVDDDIDPKVLIGKVCKINVYESDSGWFNVSEVSPLKAKERAKLEKVTEKYISEKPEVIKGVVGPDEAEEEVEKKEDKKKTDKKKEKTKNKSKKKDDVEVDDDIDDEDLDDIDEDDTEDEEFDEDALMAELEDMEV